MFTDDRPIYRQIRDVIVDRILTLGDGAMLPSVRALAAEAGVNPLTVAKAYQDLQLGGLVRARKGVGLFAADGAVTELLAQERRSFLTEEWPRVQARIARLGLDMNDLLERERA
ncbi:MAG: GntR family transcriptional regulator [Sphingomonadales bacterium]|jgi:GntR family transcriptional regulator